MKNKVTFNSELSKFGIGLFETIRIEDKPIDLQLHMNRMFNSIKELNININKDKEFIKEAILNYIEEHRIENMALRITVFDEGYNISTRDINYNEDTYNRGFKLSTSPIIRGNSILYKHKTTNYFENIYTKKYANESGFDDGLFVDMQGLVLECSMSNIFFVKDNKIYTPHKELPLLNGIMRDKVINACYDLGIETVEGKININSINEYDFVFVTNSLMKAIKVNEINNVKFDLNNEIFDKLIDYLNYKR